MKEPKTFSFKEKSIAIGLVAGLIVGVITKNIGIWLPVGIALGAGIGFTKNDNKDE